jgi:hypothetical protein
LVIKRTCSKANTGTSKIAISFVSVLKEYLPLSTPIKYFNYRPPKAIAIATEIVELAISLAEDVVVVTRPLLFRN